jgi:phosphoglycerol transferase MdoB-like AlkP superfamily enzyme
VLLGVQVGDWLYFLDANRHVSYEIRDMASDPVELLLTAVGKHSGIFIIAIFCIAGLLYAGLKLWKKEACLKKQNKHILPFGLELELSVFILLILSAVLIRGGTQDVPHDPLLAYSLGNAQSATIALNGAYMVSYSLLNDSGGTQRVNTRLTKEQKQQFDKTLLQLKHKALILNGKPKPYNVIFVLLESWSAKRMESYGAKFKTTPNFDQLMGESFSSNMMVAGGHRTTEGMFVSFCAVQNPLGQTVADGQLYTQTFNCLPDILKRKGWSSAFFQGSSKNTSNTGIFAQKLGFDASYGKHDMGKTRYPFNSWGAYDQDVYDFALDKMTNMPQPFIVGINTNTTHDEQLPDGVDALFGMDTSANKKLSVINFADEALGEFIQKIQMLNLDPTLFVLVADHTAGVKGSNFDQFKIPFLIYMPKIITPQKILGAVAQRDIAPTVLDILNVASPASFSGKSMLQKGYQPSADFYHNGTLGWIENSRLVESSVSQLDAIKCFDLDLVQAKEQEVPCVESDYALQTKSKVFTVHSQNLLFDERVNKGQWVLSP